MSEENKTRFEKASLLLELLMLNMWVTTLNEFYGPAIVWHKFYELFRNGELSNEVKMRHVLSFLKKYVYGDFGYKKMYPNRPLMMTYLYYLVDICGTHQLTWFFPMEYRVKTIEKTRKIDYSIERSAYRTRHHLAKRGNDIKSGYYKEYKAIAKKYQWPFIFNSDDSEA